MAKKDRLDAVREAQRDDALFEALGKNKKRKKSRIILTAAAIVLVLAVTAVVGVGFLRRQVREQCRNRAPGRSVS